MNTKVLLKDNIFRAMLIFMLTGGGIFVLAGHIQPADAAEPVHASSTTVMQPNGSIVAPEAPTDLSKPGLVKSDTTALHVAAVSDDNTCDFATADSSTTWEQAKAMAAKIGCKLGGLFHLGSKATSDPGSDEPK